jgi:hypothetical protein
MTKNLLRIFSLLFSSQQVDSNSAVQVQLGLGAWLFMVQQQLEVDSSSR